MVSDWENVFLEDKRDHDHDQQADSNGPQIWKEQQ